MRLRLPHPRAAGIARARRASSAAILFSVAAALISACETGSSTLSTGPNPVRCSITLAPVPMIDAAGGTGSLAVTTQPECTWDASTNVGWIFALSPASGQGIATVSFSVAANEDAAARDGTIVVNGQQTRVSQRAPCRYNLSPATQTISPSGGIANITIAALAECAWTATSEAAWISPRSSATG